MKTTEATKKLGLKANLKNKTTVKNWAIRGALKTTRDEKGHRIYDPASVAEMRKKLDALPSDYVLLGEAAKHFGVSKPYMLYLLSRGKVEAVQHPANGYWMFSREELLTSNYKKLRK